MSETTIKHSDGDFESEIKVTEKELNMWATSPKLQIICGEFVKFMKLFPDAKNYLSMCMHDPDGESWEVIIQRKEGLTPAMKNIMLEKERDQWKAKAETAISLVDGAKTIVELWEAKTPAQIVWKREWLEQARTIMKGKGIC